MNVRSKRANRAFQRKMFRWVNNESNQRVVPLGGYMQAWNHAVFPDDETDFSGRSVGLPKGVDMTFYGRFKMEHGFLRLSGNTISVWR